MYAAYNWETQDSDSNSVSNTKYTHYLKSLDGAADNYFGRGGVLRRERSNPSLLPISDNEVKFSNIFSPNESNALKLQLLQKTSSLPILDNARSINNNNNGGAGGGGDSSDDVGPEPVVGNVVSRRRRSTASGLVHGNPSNNNNNNPTRKSDSVANILYSTIRHGHEYENPSADETLHTGSDSKVDYDPHEPLPAVDQIALRHELLNNIRAISRATYFEDLYTGKVRRNSGSPETEILRLLENPQEEEATVSANEAANTIPSKDANLSRVDRWVKEASEASQGHDDDDKVRVDLANGNASLYHQTIWNEDHPPERSRDAKQKQRIRERRRGGGGSPTEGSYTESDVETASAYMRRTKPKPNNSKPVNTNNLNDNANAASKMKHFSKNSDNTSFSIASGKTNLPPGVIASTSQYLQSKYLGNNSDLRGEGKKRPFSFGYSSPDDLIPLSLSLPNVAHIPNPYHPGADSSATMSFKAHHLNHSTSSIAPSNRLDRSKKRETNHNTEQVMKLAQRPARVPQQRGRDGVRGAAARARQDHKAPALYSRLNMNKWPVKKVWFYVNGDDLFPRFEYRFRHGKDLRDLDQLLDILTKRIPSLPCGARYIFTMDGYIISSLEEMLNEHSYVVSSIRKFKTLKYGQGGSENGGGDAHNFLGKTSMHPEQVYGNGNTKKTTINNRSHHQRLNRKLSASDGNLNVRQLNRTNAHLKSSLDMQKSVSSLNSKSVSDVPRVVAHVIHEASTPSPLARQPIRVINASRPSLQSQVLLNTKTSQPFEDLVRDLAMSVRIPKQLLGNRLQTLAGRQITGYSQLRSELRAGQRAFYVYSDEENGRVNYEPSIKATGNGNHLGVNKSVSRNKPIVKSTLGKVDSNSSSDLSVKAQSRQKGRRKSQSRRRSHSPTPSLSPYPYDMPNSRSPSYSRLHA